MVCAFANVLSTQYYTDYEYSPVKSIAEVSTTGYGTNMIVGDHRRPSNNTVYDMKVPKNGETALKSFIGYAGTFKA